MNPFTAIPALYRKYVYIAWGVVVLIQGAIDVGFASANMADPTWFVVTQEVVKYLSVPIAAMAAVNVTSADGPPPSPNTPPNGGDGHGDLAAD